MLSAREKRKTVLMVSFWFPPTNLMGAVRVGKFAKYLSDYGWEPIVLTAGKVRRPVPSSLPIEVDRSRIVRTPYFSLADFIASELVAEETSESRKHGWGSIWKRSLYDRLIAYLRPFYHLPALKLIMTDPIGWYPFAIKRGLEVIKQYDVDVIFSSFGPSTSHLIASRLHKRTGIPWVADFRDLWAGAPNYPKTQPFQLLEKWIERRVIKGSNVLVTVSEPLAMQLEAFHSKRAVVITNGFDTEDLEEKVPLTSKFVLTYTGRIRSWDRKQLPQLFHAISELWQEKRISPDTFEVRFFGGNNDGTSTDKVSSLAKTCGVEPLVKTLGYIPFRESIRKQRESTALWLTISDDLSAKGVYSGKIFEYLGAGRPILASAYKGGVSDHLLAKSGTGVVVNEKDEIKLVLSKWIEEFEQQECITSHYAPNKEVIERYTRRKQAEQLSEILNEATGLREKQEVL